MESDHQISEVTADDTAAILDLMTLVDVAELGEPDHTADDVRPAIGEDYRGWVIEDSDGVAAYAWAQRRPEHLCVEGDVTVRPGRFELYQPLLDLVRPAARQLDRGLPLQIAAASQMGPKRRVLEAAGGRILRRSLRLAVELSDELHLQVPEVPTGVEIVALTDDEAELRAIHQVVDVAFLDHFGHAESAFETWLERARSWGYTDYSLWWLARVDGVPAAGLIATRAPMGGYIDTLGTLRAFRGSGLGRALMRTAFAEFRRRGEHTAVLGVDADNDTGALELYRSLGMETVLEGLRYEL